MLIAMMEGSFASSPMILSAGGQDEQPWEVKSSTTARGSAWAGRMTATIAQIPRAPDQREINLQAIVVVITPPSVPLRARTAPKCREAAQVLGRLQIARHSLRGEQIGRHSLRSEAGGRRIATPPVCAAHNAGCRRSCSNQARPGYRYGTIAA